MDVPLVVELEMLIRDERSSKSTQYSWEEPQNPLTKLVKDRCLNLGNVIRHLLTCDAS